MELDVRHSCFRQSAFVVLCLDEVRHGETKGTKHTWRKKIRSFGRNLHWYWVALSLSSVWECVVARNEIGDAGSEELWSSGAALTLYTVHAPVGGSGTKKDGRRGLNKRWDHIWSEWQSAIHCADCTWPIFSTMTAEWYRRTGPLCRENTSNAHWNWFSHWI